MRNIIFLLTFLLVSLSTLSAQEGFYAGGGLLFLNAAEEVFDQEGNTIFTAAPSFTDNNASLPQAFPNLGFGAYLGYKHMFGKDPEKLRFWTGIEFSYSRQKMEIEQVTETINFLTKVDYNFGPALRLGIQTKKLSVHSTVFGFFRIRTQYKSGDKSRIYCLETCGVSKRK